MVDGVLEQTTDWEYVGRLGGRARAGRRRPGRPRARQPRQGLGGLRASRAAFGKPTKVINDAAMQALGSYEGGRMLFLGLGTGLGTTMILDGVIAPMELGHLPYRKATFEDYVGEAGASATGTSAGRRPCSRPSRSSRPPPARLRRARRRQCAGARRAPGELPARPQRGRVPRRLPALGRGLTQHVSELVTLVLPREPRSARLAEGHVNVADPLHREVGRDVGGLRRRTAPEAAAPSSRARPRSALATARMRGLSSTRTYRSDG